MPSPINTTMNSSAVCWVLILAASCSGTKTERAVLAEDRIGYNVVKTWPHDTKAFTEGLVIHNGQLYESTGESESWIGIVDVNTGNTTKRVELERKYFGEGITILNNKVYQLTYKTKEGFVYSLKDFNKIRTFNYETEGWGLTHNGSQLIMSDGSDKLFFLDTTTLEVARTMNVTYRNQPVKELNELEFVDGYIFANVWRTDLIARIDANTGVVDAFLELGELTEQARMINNKSDVLNGIAWHAATRSLVVTGKYWPYMYILKLKEAGLTQ